MAKYCKCCEKKIRFYEENYDGFCKECHEKKLKQENELKKIREEE